MARTAGSHSDITGPRIEAAALSLIARHGYAAVSMRQIAADVGVQAGALYNYIPDKQTLLLRLMTRHMEDLLGATTGLQETDPMARLEEFVRFHISQNLHRADEVFVAYMELRNLSPENFETIDRLRSAYEQKLEDILQAGTDASVFRIADTRVAMRALIAMMNGVNTWFRDSGSLSLDVVQDMYWDMVRKAVTG